MCAISRMTRGGHARHLFGALERPGARRTRDRPRSLRSRARRTPRCASPAAMISRPTAFASAMSVPTSSPTHTSAHSAEVVRRGSMANMPGAPLQALQQVMEEDRMRLAGVRSPEQDAVGLLHLLIGAGAAAHPEHRRQTGDAGRVSGPVAAVDVVRAHHHASELLRGEVHLVGALRTTEQAERLAAMRLVDGPKPGRRLRAALRPRSPGGAARLAVSLTYGT